MDKLYLRIVKEEDMHLLFNWANDPQVRCNSFNTQDISLDEHCLWFYNAIHNSKIKIFILMKNNIPIGQVRLHLKNDEWNIGYSIDKIFRGHGFGVKIIQLIENKVDKGTHLLGQVKKENIFSQRVFLKMGYSGSWNKQQKCIDYRKTL